MKIKQLLKLMVISTMVFSMVACSSKATETNNTGANNTGTESKSDSKNSSDVIEIRFCWRMNMALDMTSYFRLG